MQIVEAIYLGGVFRPAQSISLAEGSRVMLRVETAGRSGVSPLPDPPVVTDEGPAPFDLPISGPATGVRARPGGVLLPDPPLTID